MLPTDPRMILKVINFFYFLTRPLLKWFLHRFTNLCELQRICYGCPPGALRTRKVQLSLELSRRPRIKQMVMILDQLVSHDVEESFLREEVHTRAVGTVLQVKKINPKVHIEFPRTFGTCAEKIWGFKRLFYLVEQLRSDQYDCENADHERKLLSLWTLLMGPDKLEARVSNQWQDIGFQGDDPKTDFRGMGLLGLDNLVFLATEYKETTRHLLSHSHHPTHGYFFAIVGINITSMAYHLLKSGIARTHFYNQSSLDIDAFHKFYCYLFFEFDRYWVECKPKSIMDFSWIQKKFEQNIRKLLSSDSCCLKINLAVENI
ncbi:ELMO domain-containing protein 2 [Toxorhynchites rutilus septentrionalis]|uniref:ELMO domain-containing protein 2 n=1 Tax=Toxorhynchites rutilus septentrionalis TaxID=329112 RepID=UPI00247AB2DF|nr:ELMO domain-containing protein 2 [Toxorhynchites rutilus septentrionalis]